MGLLAVQFGKQIFNFANHPRPPFVIPRKPLKTLIPQPHRQYNQGREILFNHEITPVDLVKIAKKLRTSKEFSVCSATNVAEGIKAISRYLQSSSTKISKLCLSIGLKHKEELADLSKGINGNQSLEELNLTSNGIDDEGVSTLSLSIGSHPSLKAVNLSANKISLKGAEKIAEIIEANRGLQELYLYQNQIGDKGLSSIAEALPGHPSLSKLIIGSNQITDKGAVVFFNALAQNKTKLQSLNLSNNGITNVAISSIVQFVKSAKTLTYLNLSNNKLSVLEVVVFKAQLNAVKANKDLKIVI